ncbi:Gfo/Idh/MocA family oxidoreductase [Nesterenkonia massiliensis]|uniref:Gfo/Idh/MocA family protein n=1 Tax=Nesterenkonia massiliensis TaxID=1232429 RepID=UPI0030B824BE
MTLRHPLRWGILATGGIARAFVQDAQLAGLNIVAVGSRSAESAQRFAAEFTIPRSYGSYEQLAADAEVDIIYIATPHPMHYANALLAIQHGKHALVEKPFTLNKSEAQQLKRAAQSAGVLVTEAMWTRYLPHMVRIREITPQEASGRSARSSPITCSTWTRTPSIASIRWRWAAGPCWT